MDDGFDQIGVARRFAIHKSQHGQAAARRRKACIIRECFCPHNRLHGSRQTFRIAKRVRPSKEHVDAVLSAGMMRGYARSNRRRGSVAALDRFAIELPSWGFADTGTRFGKFLQPAAAATLDEKLADAGQVHAFTGVCPTVALHVQWDLPQRARRRAGGDGRRCPVSACGQAPSTRTCFRIRTIVRLVRQSGPEHPSTRPRSLHRERPDRACARARAICRSGSPTAPTIRERQTFARGSVCLPRDSRRCTQSSIRIGGC